MNDDLEYIIKYFEDVKITDYNPQLKKRLKMVRSILEDIECVNTTFKDIQHIDHILHNIGSFLPLKDYINFSMVNKQVYSIMEKVTKHDKKSMIKWTCQTYKHTYKKLSIPRYNLIYTNNNQELMFKQRIKNEYNFTGRIYNLFPNVKFFNFPFGNLVHHYKTLTFLTHMHDLEDITKFLKDNVKNFCNKVNRIILCNYLDRSFTYQTNTVWFNRKVRMFYIKTIKKQLEELTTLFKEYKIELIFAKEYYSQNKTVGVEFYARPY